MCSGEEKIEKILKTDKCIREEKLELMVIETIPLQQTKQMKHENRKLASGSTGHLSSISYSVSDHQRGSGLWEEDVEASSSWLDLCHENGGLFLCTLCRSCLVGTQKLRGIRGGKFSKHLTFLSSVLKASSHSFSLLGPCMANKTRPPGSIH